MTEFPFLGGVSLKLLINFGISLLFRIKYSSDTFMSLMKNSASSSVQIKHNLLMRKKKFHCSFSKLPEKPPHASIKFFCDIWEELRN